MHCLNGTIQIHAFHLLLGGWVQRLCKSLGAHLTALGRSWVEHAPTLHERVLVMVLSRGPHWVES